jgi:hypothetical protein
MRISQKISNRMLRNLSTFNCMWCARQMGENGLLQESSGPYRPGALPIGGSPIKLFCPCNDGSEWWFHHRRCLTRRERYRLSAIAAFNSVPSKFEGDLQPGHNAGEPPKFCFLRRSASADRYSGWRHWSAMMRRDKVAPRDLKTGTRPPTGLISCVRPQEN